jgi:hypothetical protein
MRTTVMLLVLIFTATPSSADMAAAWSALRAGKVVALIRHADAPGTGDPAGYKLDDCTTQRNLSERGKAQAAAVGALFRANEVASDHEGRGRSKREYPRWHDMDDHHGSGD